MNWMVIFIVVLGMTVLLVLVFIYKWFFSAKSQYFAILTEQEVRKSAKIDEFDDLGLDSLDNYSGFSPRPEYVVIPVDTKTKSRLPAKIYEGESELIVLHPQLSQWDEENSLLVVNLSGKVDSKKMKELQRSRIELENYAVLQLASQNFGKNKHKSYAKYLTIEIIASGFEIAGEAKQKQEIQNTPLLYTWGITAKNSGNHKIAFTVAVENESSKQIAILGSLIHKIKVVTFIGLTQRQLRLLLGGIGAVTTILTVLQALQQLKVIP